AVVVDDGHADRGRAVGDQRRVPGRPAVVGEDRGTGAAGRTDRDALAVARDLLLHAGRVAVIGERPGDPLRRAGEPALRVDERLLGRVRTRRVLDLPVVDVDVEARRKERRPRGVLDALLDALAPRHRRERDRRPAGDGVAVLRRDHLGVLGRRAVVLDVHGDLGVLHRAVVAEAAHADRRRAVWHGRRVPRPRGQAGRTDRADARRNVSRAVRARQARRQDAALVGPGVEAVRVEVAVGRVGTGRVLQRERPVRRVLAACRDAELALRVAGHAYVDEAADRVVRLRRVDADGEA